MKHDDKSFAPVSEATPAYNTSFAKPEDLAKTRVPAGKLPTITDEIFPGRRYYEYFLQRLRSVLSHKTPVLKVMQIRDAPKPETPEGFPSIEVLISIPGFTLSNPVTGQPLLSQKRFKEFFESWPVQEQFLTWLGRYIADSIPANSPELKLKRKFRSVNVGRTSSLPPRADLQLRYQKLVRQFRTVRTWLRSPSIRNRGLTDDDKRILRSNATPDSCWWLYMVENGDLSLVQIEEGSPESTALLVLSGHYAISEDAIRSRLFRPEK